MTSLSINNNIPSDQSLLLKMHILQLQQMAAIIALSQKIDFIMMEAGISKSFMNKVRKAESELMDIGITELFKEWMPYLKDILDSDESIEAIYKKYNV